MVWIKRIFLFSIVNILVMATVTIVTSFLGVGRYMGPYGLNYGDLMVFCLVWGMAGSFISLAMSRVMAKWMMGVEVIDPNTMHPQQRELLQTVYRLAEEAGLPAHPEVGIYQSADVNAFATGPTKSRALVAVSTGLLNSMTTDERNGVLGHEIAHVANGDMVTLTLIQGIVNAFVMFFARIIGYIVANALRGDRDERPSYMVQTLVTMVLEIFLSILGSMVVAWFSRYREYRADAGGAKYAGRENMVAALQKLQMMHGGPQASSLEPEHEGERAIAAFKITGKSGSFLSLFSTHPPLEDRIARLRAARI